MPINYFSDYLGIIASFFFKSNSHYFASLFEKAVVKYPNEMSRRILLSESIVKEKNNVITADKFGIILVFAFKYLAVTKKLMPSASIEAYSIVVSEFQKVAYTPYDLWHHLLKSGEKDKSVWRNEWHKRMKLFEEFGIISLIF